MQRVLQAFCNGANALPTFLKRFAIVQALRKSFASVLKAFRFACLKSVAAVGHACASVLQAFKRFASVLQERKRSEKVLQLFC